MIFSVKKWIAFFLAGVLILTACACGVRPRPMRTEGDYLFRLGFSGAPDSCNPYVGTNSEAAAVFSLIYDTLFAVDLETGEIKGSLCESWSTEDAAAKGGRLLHLALHPGVQWHDGEPLTARDVEFTLQSMKDFSLRYSHPDCEELDTTGIAVEDETHLTMVIWGAESVVLESLSHIPIVPRHIWNQLEGWNYGASGIPDNYRTAAMAVMEGELSEKTLVGTGLYTWKGVKNGICTLKRNDGYWNGSAQAGTVKLCFGLEDPGANLQSGEIDACWDMSGAWFEELGRRRNVTLGAGTAGELFVLELNLHQDRALLGDSHVRHALDYCMDKAGILNGAFGGGIPANSFLMPQSPWAYEDALVSLRNHSPESAAWLLGNTGYPDADGDGIRENADGERLSFSVIYSDSSPAWAKAVELLSADCRKAGIELTGEGCSPEELTERALSGDFDLLLTGIRTGLDPAFSLGAFAWNGGANAFSGEVRYGRTASPGWNLTGYHSGAFDELYETMLNARGEERRSALISLGQLLYEDAPVLPLGFKASYQGCSSAWPGLTRFRGDGLLFTPETLREQLQSLNAINGK